MFKPGDQLVLTTRPGDMPEDWKILGCYFKRMVRANTMHVGMVVLVGGIVEMLNWNFDTDYCKPRLISSPKFNFKFGRAHDKVQQG